MIGPKPIQKEQGDRVRGGPAGKLSPCARPTGSGNRRRGWRFLVLACLAGIAGPAAASDPPLSSPETPTYGIEWQLPPIGVSGLPITPRLRATGLSPGEVSLVEIRITASPLPSGPILASQQILLEGEQPVSLEPLAAAPRGTLYFHATSSHGVASNTTLRVLPGFLTILPPLFAIAMALAFRQVVIALFAGTWLGAFFLYDFNPFSALLRCVDHFAMKALTDPDKVSICLFTLLLGGMIGVISRSGGIQGIVAALSRLATNRRRGQIATWAMGILVFFDDYSNTLIVGPTMRPITDRLGISREKLAYIVDTTAASIASIALVSSWIGFEVSLIGDGLAGAGIERDPYGTFLNTIPYCFYPWMALVLCFLVGFLGRDFGSMYRAERRAREGKVLGPTATPLSDFDTAAFKPVPDRPHRWFNAVVPVFALISYIFFGLWSSGRAALVDRGDPAGLGTAWEILTSGGGIQDLGTIFGAADSFQVLLQASLIGGILALLLAFTQGILSISEGFQAWTNGIKAMLPAFVVLALAWSIGLVCEELQTADYLVSLLSDTLSPAWLPTLIFLGAACVSFATGTSWGTMAILLPIAIPLAHQMTLTAGLTPGMASGILFGSIASVLSGAVFGDHCSPISDTTILSSMASSSDLIDHVRTQLPYALLGAGVAVLAGTIPVGFGMSPWIGLFLGSGVLFATIRLLGRPVED
ncbi:MAG: Na+/H+ antiporter NhaC family protein [Acidobacteria bacterium]|nr:Na+/H+ antiporter NhaC family protein [Acidobacteriota bacterium]